MPRILIVSAHFPPSSAVGGRRPARFARVLPEHGYEVDVVCATPWELAPGQLEHPSPPDPSQHELVPDERRVLRIEPKLYFGRDPFNRPPRTQALRFGVFKAISYLDALVMTRDWSWRWGKEAARHVEERGGMSRYDLLVADLPPLPAVVPLVRLARARGIPVVSDFRDIWMPYERRPTWSVVFPRSRRQLWWDALSREVVRDSARVVLNTPVACEVARQLFPTVDPEHFRTVTNAFDCPDSDQDAAPGRSGNVRIVYTGSLAYGRDQLVKRVIRAMGILRRQGGEQVELVLAGGTSDELREVAEEEGLSAQVRFVGWVERDEAVRIQREAGALLLLQPPDAPGTSEAIPAKLFEYMERRRHILSISTPAPDHIVREHDLGVVASDLSERELAGALKQLARKVRERPVLPPPPEAFSGDRTVAILADILSEVLIGGEGSGPRRQS